MEGQLSFLHQHKYHLTVYKGIYLPLRIMV